MVGMIKGILYRKIRLGYQERRARKRYEKAVYSAELKKQRYRKLKEKSIRRAKARASYDMLSSGEKIGRAIRSGRKVLRVFGD